MDDHGAQLTERDRRVLEFAAQQRLVLAAQVANLLGVSPATARGRLHRLSESGHVRFERELSGPGCYLIERPDCARSAAASLHRAPSTAPSTSTTSASDGCGSGHSVASSGGSTR